MEQSPQDYAVSDDPNGPVARIVRAGTECVRDLASGLGLEGTAAGGRGTMISYGQVAPATGTLVMTLDSLQSGDSMHFYGSINESIALPGDSDRGGMPANVKQLPPVVILVLLFSLVQSGF